MTKRKTLLPILFLALVIANNVGAFEYDNLSAEQVDNSNNLQSTAEGFLTLDVNQNQVKEIIISPDYENDKHMYVIASSGVYKNLNFDAKFMEEDTLNDMFPSGITDIKFVGNYKDLGYLLAYDKNNIYLSYNRGSSWSELNINNDEEITFADFGPNFGANQQIYFISESGLYRKSLSNYSETLLMESTVEEPVEIFAYNRLEENDSVFNVAKGNTIYRTENYGSSWLTKTFESEIKDFTVISQSASQGDLMVLTEDNKMHYSTSGLTFYELVLPSAITEIYNSDHVIRTNDGIYITYNNGSSWIKNEYVDISDTKLIGDFAYNLDGTQKYLFIIYDGKLYRDLNIGGTMNLYMEGIDAGSAYLIQGEAISQNILSLYEEKFSENYFVTSATLSADGDLNGQTMAFYITADGENWEELVLDEEIIFAAPGRDLRWKVVMATDDTAVTPVLRSVSVNFGVEETEEPAEETICAGFPDVPAEDPLCPAITYVRDRGIFEGYPDGTFMPDEAINRAETVKVITEGFDIAILEDDGTNLGFSDVIIGEWYMGYLRTAKEGGVIEGYPDGTFKPEQTVNYVEMMKIFLETAGAELAADGAEWYSKYVDFATANDLVEYTQLDAGMKRGDVALLFYQWSLLTP